MYTYVLMTGIAVGTILLIWIVFVIFSRSTVKSRSSKKTSKGLEEDQIFKSPPDPSNNTLPLRSGDPRKEVTYFLNKDIPLIDTSGCIAESPEISVSEVEATLIDLIRQAIELPSALMELSQMLRDPEANIKEVARLVATDPVLSSSILRIANSAAVGRGKITSVQKAIMLLGFNQVWILVNQMLTSRAIKPIAKVDEVTMKKLWLHGAASAVCAKHILSHLGLWGTGIESTTMTCALIHDVGKFLLRGFSVFDHDALKASQGEEEPKTLDRPLIDIEREFYSIDHTRVGFLLTTYWRLPEEICTVVGYHHYPFSSNHSDAPRHVERELAIVAYADYLAQVSGYLEHPYGVASLNPEALKKIGTVPPFGRLIDRKLIHDLRQTARLIEMASE